MLFGRQCRLIERLEDVRELGAFFGKRCIGPSTTTLTDFGFDSGTLWIALVSFNLGIEAMQLVVIAARMPSLVILARAGLRSSSGP